MLRPAGQRQAGVHKRRQSPDVACYPSNAGRKWSAKALPEIAGAAGSALGQAIHCSTRVHHSIDSQVEDRRELRGSALRYQNGDDQRQQAEENIANVNRRMSHQLPTTQGPFSARATASAQRTRQQALVVR